MLRFLCAGLSALVLAFPAAACRLPLDLAEARIRVVVPAESLEVERHEGPEVAPVLARLNAEPPETGFAADTMLIAYWRGQPGAVILLGLGGCLVGEVMMPASRARLLFGEAL
ncbi:MAG: hypothetical protein FJX60_15705 [Alphaproteobacteria bacterium]|nr:hypothetical protein [Alphaproteobacteria bacterium]